MSKGEFTRTHILDQAVQLTSVHGLHGLTIGSLAEHTHLSKGGICAHFSSKQALQLAVIEHASDIFQRAVIQPVLTSSPGRERLEHLGQTWLEYLQQRIFVGGCFFSNVVLEVDDLEDQEVRVSVLEYYQQFLAFVRQEAEEALRLGQFRASVLCDQFVFEFAGILLGTVMWRGLEKQSEGIVLARRSLAGLLSRAQS